jgi:hypothetical protein
MYRKAQDSQDNFFLEGGFQQSFTNDTSKKVAQGLVFEVE